MFIKVEGKLDFYLFPIYYLLSIKNNHQNILIRLIHIYDILNSIFWILLILYFDLYICNRIEINFHVEEFLLIMNLKFPSLMNIDNKYID